MRFQAFLVVIAVQLAVVQGKQQSARHAHLKRQVDAAHIAPIASITASMPPPPTPTFSTTHKPGDAGAISGAPAIPTPSPLSFWPPQDKVPDTTSPEVQVWLKELNGFNIPAIRPNKDSTCAGDPEAATNAAQNGWWTCGGHTRPTDILVCPNKLDWGISFDDGPSPYSNLLLDKLKSLNIKSTFFVVGSRAAERPAMVVEEYFQGHEISVHTWSHRSLTTLTTEEIVAELGWTRKAIKHAIGITPTTMRPPRGDIDDRVRAISLAMGLVPIIWTNVNGNTFDSFDWRVSDGSSNGTAHVDGYKKILDAGTSPSMTTGFVTLQHDLYPQTVDLAVGYTLDLAVAHTPKLNIQPIGQCNKIPNTNLYFETNQNKTFPYTNHTVSIDGVSGAIATTVSLGITSIVGLAVVSLLL